MIATRPAVAGVEPRYLLDTCAVIDFLRGDAATVARLARITNPLEIAVCAVTEMEIELGFLAKPSARKREGSGKLYRAFVDSVTRLNIDFEDARETAAIRHSLDEAGKRIEVEDVLIGAIARRRRLIVVTSNTKHLARISGLRCENWRVPD